MMTKRAHYFIACLCIQLFSADVFFKSASCEDTIPSTNPPRVSLSRYRNQKSHGWVTIEKENSAPEIVSKDGDDYIISDTDSVSDILFTCQASYPIYWSMTDVKPTNIKGISTNSKVILDGNKQWSDAVAKEFISYLVLPNDVSFTGLYTCSSVEDDNLKTGTYIYTPGFHDKAKTLLGAGDELEVGLNGNNSVVLPCKISNKNAEVSLSKQDEAGKWVALDLNNSFDPTKGFSLDKSKVDPIIGKYKCSVTKPKEEDVIVDVLSEVPVETALTIKNELDKIARWGGGRYSDVHCCSNSTKSPNLLVVQCNNRPECDMKQAAFTNIWPNVKSTTQGVESTSSRRSCSTTVGNRIVVPILIKCEGDGIDTWGPYEFEFDPNDSRKNKFVPSPTTQNFEYNIKTAMRAVVLKWENTSTTNFYRLLDLNKTDLYKNQKFVIECCGLHYHHGIGRMQRIVWNNGTTTTLTTPEKDFFDLKKHAYVKDFCYDYKYDADVSEEYLITAHENMSRIECIVPRWYNKTPGIISFPLNIKVPAEPVIIGSSDTVINITYSENQVGLLQLECKLSDGVPTPTLVWKKDGYKLNQTDLYWSTVESNAQKENSEINVLFMRATKEIEGEYECTAENWEGMDQKTYIVKVKPRSYLDYWIALVIFGGFFALIICCALRISTLEKQTVPNPKQVEPITFTPEN